jgi:hypothetical protein
MARLRMDLTALAKPTVLLTGLVVLPAAATERNQGTSRRLRTAQDVELSLRDRVRAGDPDTFGVLFDDSARAVYNLAFRMTGNWSAAEEVVSPYSYARTGLVQMARTYASASASRRKARSPRSRS